MMEFCTVRRRVRRLFRLRSPLAEYLRGVLSGAAVTFAMAEAVAHRQLAESVTSGDLPWFTLDAALVSVAALEALVATAVAVKGRRRRWLLLVVSMLVPAVLVLAALAAPGVDAPNTTDLCPSAVEPRRWAGVGWRAGFRLLVLVALGAGTAVARVAAWTHGLAYLAEHDHHNMLMHFGVVTAMRVVGLVAVPRVLTSGSAAVAAAGVACPLLLHAAQLLLVPRRAPPQPPPPQHHAMDHVMEDDDRTGKGSSVWRVLRSAEAMRAAAAAALMVAALWGFGYHEGDIAKTQYLVERQESALAGQAVIIRCLVLVLAVILVAKSKGGAEPFDRAAVAKLAAVAAALAVPVFALMVTVASCERGLVAPPGARPECAHCGCNAPWLQFAPVCVGDEVTTFLHPCHAGCTRAHLVGGIQVYSNCTCAAGPVGSVGGVGVGRGTRGACAAVQCAPSLVLYETLFALVLVLSVVAFQCLGVGALRAVRPRDRGAALGVLAAVGALALACSHVLYRTMAVLTCSWSVNGRCNVQRAAFPWAAGGVSAALAGCSACVSLASWLAHRRSKPPPPPSPPATAAFHPVPL